MQRSIKTLLNPYTKFYSAKKAYKETSRTLFRLSSNVVSRMADQVGVPLETVIDSLEKFAPIALSEKWDNTGLLIQPFTPRPITKILLTNDLTEDVVEEANSLDVEMIISYHPPIFAPLKSITQRTWKERITSVLLEKRIALYSPHTSWDSVKGGVSDWLASALEYDTSEPITEGATPGTGCGRILSLKKPAPLSHLVQRVKQLTDLKHVRLAIARGENIDSPIRQVALCAGSGASVLKDVKADLYITGEMLHHDVLDAVHRGTSVILTNHSDSERGFLKVFSPLLMKMLNNSVSVHVSNKDSDPLKTV